MNPRTVLVTGGVRRLGAAIVRRLASDGHALVIHHRWSEAEAEALAVELRATGALAATVGGDLADPGGIDDLWVRAREAAGGPIYGLVNSASAFEFDRPPVVDPALMVRLVAINLTAPVLLACALAAQDDLADGSVVNILDQKVANLNPDFFSYSCGKIGLAGATTMLAQALGPRVRVSAVAPGLTLPSGDQSEAEFAAVASRNLLRRPVGADAVADAVAYLIGSHGVNGQNIYVDAGQRFLPRDGDVMFKTRGCAGAEGSHG